jgi:hypothetical protein
LPVKGNQGKLYGDLQAIFDESKQDKIRNNSAGGSNNYQKTEAREQGRAVIREYMLEKAPGGLYNRDRWQNIQSVGLEHKTIHKYDAKAEQTKIITEMCNIFNE